MLVSQNEVFDPKSLRRALRDWHSLKALSEHPLAGLAVVQTRRAASGYSDSVTGRGLALRDTLVAALDTMKASDGRRLYEYRKEFLTQATGMAKPATARLVGSIYVPEPIDGESYEVSDKTRRYYFILTEQYLHGRNPEWVAEQLHISKGTYFSEQKTALELLAGMIEKWEEQQKSTQSPLAIDSSPAAAQIHRTPFLAPSRSTYRLTGCEDLLDSLLQKLLEGDTRDIALYGIPGVGKTALAVELAHDARMLECFPDGVLWANLGRQPEILFQQELWAVALGLPEMTITKRGTPAERTQMLRAAMGMRRMLLVIGDVWRVEDALAFHIGGPLCTHLLTTRLPGVARDFSFDSANAVTELGSGASLALLEQFVPGLLPSQSDAAKELAEETGGLPLALVLAGEYLRRSAYGIQPRRLQAAISKLESPMVRYALAQSELTIPHQTTMTASTPVSLQDAITTSYTAVSLAAQKAWRSLSLFAPKPNTFSEDAAITVAAAPVSVLDELVDIGVLECPDQARYTMHPTIAGYAALQKAEPGAVRRMVEYFLRFAAGFGRDFKLLDDERTNLLTALALAEGQKFQLSGEPGMDVVHAYLECLRIRPRIESASPEIPAPTRENLPGQISPVAVLNS